MKAEEIQELKAVQVKFKIIYIYKFKKFIGERSPIERCLTYSDNNENNIKTSLNGLNNIITIKLNEHQARSNSGHKYYDRNFERSVTEDNKKIISSANKLCYRNTFDIPQKEEISEKTEDDNSLDTITLYDDKSVFDHSFQDDFKEFIQKGRERVQNYNELVQNTNSENKNNIKLIKSELGADARPSTGSGSSTPHTSNFNNNLNINININSNSLSNYSLEEKLKEEIYKSIQDPTKRKKYEDYIMRGLKTATLSSPSKTSPNSSPNSNKQISYQIIEKDFILGYLEKNKTSKGVIFSENGDLYEGEFLNGKKDGYGVIIYKNGTKYEGIFKLNKQHGYGKLFQCDGEIYIGEWKEGRINGNGVRYHSNGDKYTGQYINNIRNGAGTYLFANGDCYEGNWTNGKASGKGKFSYSNGNFYEGEFVENQICGKGIFTCANGDVYRGTFKNGLITGQGMLKTYKGETFQGEFFKGKKHGFGNLYSLEGILMYSGFWNQDNYVGKKNPIS